MITHNRAADAQRALGRMLGLREAARVVLVDNGSTDGTAAIVRRRLPAAEVIALARNVGAAARNVGVAAVSEPYVAFCDDDTWWAPGSLARAVAALEAHAQLAVVTGRVLVGEEGREDPTCAVMAASPVPAPAGFPGRAVIGFMAGACMVRRSAFLAAGGFEPRLFFGREEALLAIDLAARGWRMTYVPEVLVHHHPSPRRDTVRRHRRDLRNQLWLAWLRRPLAVALASTAGVARDGLTDPAARRALAAALAGTVWVLRHRRVVSPELDAALRLIEAPPAGVPGQAAPSGGGTLRLAKQRTWTIRSSWRKSGSSAGTAG
jgi:GT2 family glycosyltransferase